MKTTIGQSIAKHRKKAGLTQEELAEKCNVTAQAVSKWENDLSYPDLESTARLADILGCTVDALIHGEEEVPLVQLKPTENIGRRMLEISVIETYSGGNGTVVKARFPAELLLFAEEAGTLEELIDDDEAKKALSPALKLLRSGAVGTVTEVTTDQAVVKIEVTDYAD